MTSDLPLWAAVKPQDPGFLVVPSTELEKRFKSFHEANPHVYTWLEEKALELVRAGRSRIGVAELIEDLRYVPSLFTKGEAAFKLNNSYRAFYARLLVHRRKELEPVIQLRRQTNATHKFLADPDYQAGRRFDE